MSPYFLAEERHRAGRDRLLRVLDRGVDGLVLEDRLVDDPLDLLSLLGRDGGEVDEVEAQAIGRDERARLLDVPAEHLAQRGVQQVRGGVIAPRRITQLAVDFGADDVARGNRAARCPRADARAAGPGRAARRR